MKRMEPYCKVYPVDQLSRFSGWSERARMDESDREAGYLFLQPNLTVTRDIFSDEGVVFDDVTEDWREFCSGVLEFRVPEYIEIEEADQQAQP